VELNVESCHARLLADHIWRSAAGAEAAVNVRLAVAEQFCGVVIVILSVKLPLEGAV